MIAMFMGKQDAIQLLRHYAALLQTQNQLPRAQPAVDKNFAVIGRDQGAVPRAPAAEHGQAEHGFQGSCMSSDCANGIVASLRTESAKRGIGETARFRDACSTGRAARITFALLESTASHLYRDSDRAV